MMAQLINESAKNTVIEKLEIANSFAKRLRGLLGRTSLEENSGLWIRRTNSIHTFFMKFDIDVIFLDRDLKIKKCVPNLGPNELVWPVWGATSVVEMSAGKIEKINAKIGDQLHVVD